MGSLCNWDGSRTTPHEDNWIPHQIKIKAQPLPTRTTIPRTIPHQDNSPLGPLPRNSSSFVSIISEFSHMFGQALAQWRSLLISSCQIFQLHSFSRSGHLSRCCMSALRSRIHRLYLLYQHSPIYSCWFCCGPIPVRSLLRDFHSFHSDLWPGANCSLVGLAALLGVALQIVVPPIMLALLFEEVVTVAGLHEGSSSLISGGLGLVGGYDRDGECHQLASWWHSPSLS